jgi:hypothetical protein
MFSGGYMPDDVRLAGHGEGSVQQPFSPSGLSDIQSPAPPVQRLALAELGEAGVPESLVDLASGSKKHRREIIVIPGTSFRPPSSGPFERSLTAMLSKAIANAVVTTEPSTDPASTQPAMVIHTHVELTAEESRKIQEEYDRELREQIAIQSAAEVHRLCDQARLQNADALLLMTCYRHVGEAKGTGWGFLNYLILPAFVIPTDSFQGEVSARAWLIDPTDAHVIRSVTWEDRYHRYSPIIATDDRRDQLWDDQREDALREVAKKLLE